MSLLDLDGTCPTCGCSGLHACPGYMMKPWTPEDIARLESALRRAFKEEKEAKTHE